MSRNRPDSLHSTAARLSVVAAVMATGCMSADDHMDEEMRMALPCMDTMCWEDPPWDPTDPLPPDPPPPTPTVSAQARVVSFRNGSGEGLCSGIALTPTLVLTAAHCAFDTEGNVDLDDGSVTIGLGSELCQFGEAMVVEARKHPSWGESIGVAVDLAVLRLSSPLAGLENVPPVAFGSASVGDSVVVAGIDSEDEENEEQVGLPGTVGAIDFEVPNDTSGVVPVVLGMGDNLLCGGSSGSAAFASGTNTLVGIVARAYNKPTDPPGCGKIGFAADDWDFVQSAMNEMGSSTGGVCSPGSNALCRPDGAECTNDLTCYGTTSCGEAGAWGPCEPLREREPEDCDSPGDEDCDGLYDEDDDDCAGSSCICGFDCPPGTPECNGFCGDGSCDLITENSTTCPADCSLGGSCICGWDCPPGTPECAGFCGDGSCDLITENSTTCPMDCSLGGCMSDWDCPPGEVCWGSGLGVGECGPDGNVDVCYPDGVCTAGETCACEVFCCGGGGGGGGDGGGTGPGGSCGWDGGPTIAYEDCFACGGTVTWGNDGPMCEGMIAQ
jgi:hypothetical protein